jgi:hypothetical protein
MDSNLLSYFLVFETLKQILITYKLTPAECNKLLFTYKMLSIEISERSVISNSKTCLIF